MTTTTASRTAQPLEMAERYATAARKALDAIEAHRVKMCRVADDRARNHRASVALGVAVVDGLVNGHTTTPEITAARAACTEAGARLAQSAALALETSHAAEDAVAALGQILDQIRESMPMGGLAAADADTILQLLDEIDRLRAKAGGR